MPTSSRQVRIREVVGQGQLKEINKLQKECLPNDYIYNAKVTDGVYGAYVGKELVGFGVVAYSAGYQQTAYLARAGVKQGFNGLGIQKRLIRARERWARKRGLKYVITDTAAHNAPSMRSLIACGYKPFWPTLRQPWGRKDSVYWLKRI